MKLYATVTSERASKGQGGQKFLLTTIKDMNGDTILNLCVTARDEVSEDGMLEYLIDIDGAVNKKVVHWARPEQKLQTQNYLCKNCGRVAVDWKRNTQETCPRCEEEKGEKQKGENVFYCSEHLKYNCSCGKTE